MASTFFEHRKTPIQADWLNDVNDTVYGNETSQSVKNKLQELVSFDDFLTPIERAAAISGAVVDMTTSMNTALASARKVVAVAGRSYRFTTLDVLVDNTTIVVEGGASLIATNATITGINVEGDNCRIVGEGIIFSPTSWDGSNSRRTYATVWVEGDSFTFDGVTLFNIPRAGIHFEDATNGRVQNARLIGNYPFASYNPATTTGHCAIDYNPPTNAGPTTPSGNGSLVVTGCRIESSIQGVFFGNFDSAASEVGVTITGNNFAQCWDHAVYTSLAKATVVSGNTMVNCKNPVVVDGVGCVVSGNTLYATEGTQSNGQQVISVRDCSDAVITGNTLIGLGASIDVACVSGTTLRRNKVQGNIIRSLGVGLASAPIRLGLNSQVCEDNEISGNIVSGGFIAASNGAVTLVTAGSSFVATGTRVIDNTFIVEGVLAGETSGVYAVDHDDLTIRGNRIKCTATAASSLALRQIFLTRCGDYTIEDNRLEYLSGGTNVIHRGIQTDEIGFVRRNIFRNTAPGLSSSNNTGFVAAGSDISDNDFTSAPLRGLATLVAGTATVSTTEIRTGDRVRLTRQTLGGAVGHLSLGAITNGVSFVINSSSATETSTVFWEIVH
jgi:hypothetical protein